MTSHTSPADVRVAVGRLDLPQPRVAALAATLSVEEVERAQTMAPDRARRFVAARGTLRELLGSLIGLAPSDVKIGYGAHGKPELDGPLRFSVSHSGELVLIAVALGREVGVDVELVRRLFDRDGFARAVLETEEQEAVTQLPETARDSALLAAWTRKEALLKAAGEGLGPDLEAVIGKQATRFTVHPLAPAPGYIGALAVERSAA
jgi:4'-phosphopantetheinyl transferase